MCLNISVVNEKQIIFNSDIIGQQTMFLIDILFALDK